MEVGLKELRIIHRGYKTTPEILEKEVTVQIITKDEKTNSKPENKTLETAQSIKHKNNSRADISQKA